MKNPIVLILIGVVVLGAGFFLLNGKAPEETAQEPSDMPIPVEGEGFETGGALVRYTEEGFVPATITVPLGTTVMFMNESSREMWVGVDEHPTHTGYDGTSKNDHCGEGESTAFDQCRRGDSYSFTFTKAGAFDYHDHVNASFGGTVVVTE
jgi:plastocyanin